VSLPADDHKECARSLLFAFCIACSRGPDLLVTDNHPFFLQLACSGKDSSLQLRLLSPKPSQASHSGFAWTIHKYQSAPDCLCSLACLQCNMRREAAKSLSFEGLRF